MCRGTSYGNKRLSGLVSQCERLIINPAAAARLLHRNPALEFGFSQAQFRAKPEDRNPRALGEIIDFPA